MDASAGITWHQVNPEIDKGDIICQRDLEVSGDINAIHLTQQTLDLGAQAFHDILASLLDGTYSTKPVGHHERETFHRSSDVPNDGILDLAWGLPKTYAFLRSLDYGKLKVLPPAQIRLLGKQFSVLNYCAKPDNTTPSQGFSVEARDDQLLLREGSMCLVIHFRQT